MLEEITKTNFRDNSGRKPKKEQIRELLEQYPDKSLRELEKVSGISRPTIIKWKKYKNNNI